MEAARRLYEVCHCALLFVVVLILSSGSDGWDGRHAAGDAKRRTAGGSRSCGDEARVTRSGSRVDVSTATMVGTNRETDII